MSVQGCSEGSSRAAGMPGAGLFIVRRCVALFFWAELCGFFLYLFIVPEILSFGKGCTSVLQWTEHYKVFLSLKFIGGH